MLQLLFPHKKKIYLDYAASTPVTRPILRAMQPYWSDEYANPNSIHASGLRAKKKIEECNSVVRTTSHMKKNAQVLWTSGGTESNQLAIDSALKSWKEHNPKVPFKVVLTYGEHSSILDYLDKYDDDAMTLLYAKLDTEGSLDLENLRQLVDDQNVALVVAQLQSSEIGATQQVAAIGKIIKNKKSGPFPVLHVDASQGLFYNKIDMNKWQADSVTLCGQKINGPKGSGILLGKESQQFDRDGTPAVPLIVGTTTALAMAQENWERNQCRILQLRNTFFTELQKHSVAFEVNGRIEEPSLVINISFINDKRDSEELIIAFDRAGLEVSSKSACMGSQASDSRVLDSMGLQRTNSIRISLHHQMSSKTMKKIAETISKIVD